MATSTQVIDKEDYKYGFHYPEEYVYKEGKGLNEKVVLNISKIKNDPGWVRDFRLNALKVFFAKKMPTWGADLSNINFDDICYYIKPIEGIAKEWEELPENIRKTWDRLGIPEAERKFLSGIGAQMESENVYHKILKDLALKGVVFVDPDVGLNPTEERIKEMANILDIPLDIARKNLLQANKKFKEFFGTIIPAEDNKFAALNSTVFSGGSFVYIPKDVKLDMKMPLQAYFRINASNMGQFERTLIIADEGSVVSYLEGCSAPVYSKQSLHSAVVEVVALKNSKVRYTTIQNWSTDVYNLVTKRAHAYENAIVEWIDANLGCLAEGTTIFTNPGIKKIEEVLPGEKVITLNEKTKELEAKRVLGIKFSGIKPTYRVVLDNGKREIISTKNHPFLVLKHYPNRPSKLGRYEFIWTPLSDISEGSFLLVPKEIPDLGKPYDLKMPDNERTILGHNQYGAEFIVSTNYKYKKINLPKQTSDDLLWLFGFTIGDGNIDISKSKKTGVNRYGGVIFSVPDSDPAREKVVKIMSGSFGLIKYTERKDKVTITYSSLFLAEFFKLNGIEGNAYTKRVPEFVFGLPLNQKRAFIAGYLEADGKIIKNTARLKTCNGSLLEDLKKLAITCGIEVNKIKKKTEKKKILINGYNAPEKEYTYYQMYISNLFKLRRFLSPGNRKRVPYNVKEQLTYHFTKTRRLRLPEHLALLPITSITYFNDIPTYDLEIEDTHNFIANGVIVHNSHITMKYPSIYLLERNAKADIISVAFAGKGQHLDTGAKAVHLAPNTTSTIISKSISKNSGRASYRGLLKIAKGASYSKSRVNCDALLLDEESRSDTYPYIEVDEDTATMGHEATVGKVGEDQLFYLMSRGLKEEEALAMIVLGFLEPFSKELPMEYAVELNKLIKLEMEGSVG